MVATDSSTTSSILSGFLVFAAAFCILAASFAITFSSATFLASRPFLWLPKEATISSMLSFSFSIVSSISLLPLV